MKRKQKMLRLAIEIIALVFGLIFIVMWVANEKKEVIIYDFSRSIEYNEKANYALQEQDIVATSILAADVQDYYITDPTEAVGKYITSDCLKNSHIQTNQLSSDPTFVESGAVSELADYRKFYIKVGIGDVFAGDIEAGDTVDIMFTDAGSGYASDRTESFVGSGRAINYTNSKIIMQNIPVYQVYLANGQVYKKAVTDPATLNRYSETGDINGDTSDTAASGTPAYVALSVTAKQYEELSTRSRMGVISLVARFDESKDTTTNGYLVFKGDYANIYAGEGSLEYSGEISADGSDTLTAPVVENTSSIPSLYSFIRNLMKVSMTQEQRDRYNAVYARYSDLMNKYFGTEWELNDPDSVTYEMLANQVGMADEQAVSTLLAFRTDLEALAKELKGENVLLPW